MRIKLRVVQGTPLGKQLIFGPGEFYFGRGEECHVRPNSAMVSRQHCLLRVDSAGVFLKDLGSRNGTLVNGTLISQEQQLKPGDQIQIGQLVFELSMEELSGPLVSSSQIEAGVTPVSETAPEIGMPDSKTETTEHSPLNLPQE